MLILTIRTDQPKAELGLYQDNQQLTYHTWLADRRLAETIHSEMKQLLSRQRLDLDNIEGIIVYPGPGSFTGLRIGLSVANSLADSLDVPIVAPAADDWISQGLSKLQSGQDQKMVMPRYGALPHITTPKK